MMDNHQEYERLIAPIEARMIRVVWRILRDASDAEDAFQQALLIVWKCWDRILTHPNPHALVLHICVNAAHDLLRRKARLNRRSETSVIWEDIAVSSPSAVQLISHAEQSSQLRRAIGLLSRNQGRAILMHAVEEMPYSEIAALMDCREVTVRKHVARARAKLRTLLPHLIPAGHKEEGCHA
jgi:RNA polymerase sigma-70 factor, ECF subfamily